MFVCCVRCHGCHYSTPGVRVTVKMWESSDEDTQSPTRAWRKNGLVENKFSVSERKQLWAIVHATGILSCHSSLPFINATHTLSSERWMICLRTFNWYSVIKKPIRQCFPRTIWCAVKNLVMVASEVGHEFKNLKIKGKPIMELSSMFLWVV